jgi:hypothetical protein
MQHLSCFEPEAVICHVMHQLAIEPDCIGEDPVAQPMCMRDDDVKDGLDVGRRSGDHLQNLTCRGQVAVARLQLGEQPYVLNGDDRLIGEGLHECDLLGRKRPLLSAPNRDDPERLVAMYHRHRQHRAISEDLPGLSNRFRVCCVAALRLYVLDLNRPARKR